jgi:DNA-binding response OmpR family regulator
LTLWRRIRTELHGRVPFIMPTAKDDVDTGVSASDARTDDSVA